MSNPRFPDPFGRRELLEPGATASGGGLSLEQRVAALEQGLTGFEQRTGQDMCTPVLAETTPAILSAPFDPWMCEGAGTIEDGRIFWVATYIDRKRTITGAAFIQVTQGVYTADNNSKFGLYTESGGTLTRVAASTNDTALFKGSANSLQKKAFSATYNAEPGVYWIALIANWSAVSTAPTMESIGVPSGAVASGFGYRATSLSGQTDLPASQVLASTSLVATIRWMALY